MITKDVALTTDHVNEVRKCFGLSPVQPIGATRVDGTHHVDWNHMPFGVGVLMGITHPERTMCISTFRTGNVRTATGAIINTSMSEHRRVIRFAPPIPGDTDTRHRFVSLGQNYKKVVGNRYKDHGEIVSKMQGQFTDTAGNYTWGNYDAEPIGIIVPSNSGMRGLRDRSFFGLPIGSVVHQQRPGGEEPFMIIGKKNLSKTPRFIGIGLESFDVHTDICPRFSRSNRRGRLSNIRVATVMMSPYVGASIVLPTDNMSLLASAIRYGYDKSKSLHDFKSELASVFDWANNGTAKAKVEEEIALAAANDWGYWAD